MIVNKVNKINEFKIQTTQTVTNLSNLLDIVQVRSEDLPWLPIDDSEFPLLVSKAYVERINKNDPYDPLLLQILPTSEELSVCAGFCKNPLKEVAASPVKNVIRKYSGRVLVIVTGNCSIHCRFCFRRYYPFSGGPLSEHQWLEVVNYIAKDSTIREIILSGGDPLTISNAGLAWMMDALFEIKHVATIRIHTRMPISVPWRVDEKLIRILVGLKANPILIVHVNHPNEIDADVRKAVKLLRNAGICVLNQGVLLRHVNDSVCVQKQLSECLFDAGILPYYLHTLDRTLGTHQFEVPDREARMLFAKLLEELPGYLVPRLVKDIPGYASKVLVRVDQAKRKATGVKKHHE